MVSYNTIQLQRPNIWDWAKVIGIFCVIIGHYVYYFDISYTKDSWDWYIAHFITLFHMPLFFIISGILYTGKGSQKSRIIKDIKNLVVPYLLICLIDGIFYYTLIGEVSLNEIVKYMFGVIGGGDFYYKIHLYPAGPLWFLYSMFIVRFIYYFIEDSKYKLYSVLCLALCVMFVNKDILPFRIDSSLIGLLFFFLGNKFKDVWMKIVRINNIECLALFVIGSTILFLFNEICFNHELRQGMSININYFGKYPLLFILSGIVGTITVLCISNILDSNGKIQFVYKYSVGLIIPLGFHKLIMITMRTISPIYNIFISGIICFIVSYFLIVFVMRNCPILIGSRSVKQ